MPSPATPDVTGLAISVAVSARRRFRWVYWSRWRSAGLLPQFDYLSTVSGGGYLGAF